MIFLFWKLNLVLAEALDFSLSPKFSIGAKLVCPFVFVCSILGCTNVYISENGEIVRVERHMGFVSVTPPSDTAIHSIELKGTGFIQTSEGFSLGYHEGSFISASPECKIVLIVETEQNIQRLVDLLKKHGEVCISEKQSADH